MPPLQWRHNECDGVSNHRCFHCFPNCCFRHRSKKTSELCVTGLCAGNSPVTGEFPPQKASNTENVSIWWHHHTTETQQPARHWDSKIVTLTTISSFRLLKTINLPVSNTSWDKAVTLTTFLVPIMASPVQGMKMFGLKNWFLSNVSSFSNTLYKMKLYKHSCFESCLN